jgi:hypothetical protein
MKEGDYLKLSETRKELLRRGEESKAAKCLEIMQVMVEKGRVSAYEIELAAY